MGSEGLYRYQQDQTTGYTASDLLDRIGQTTAKLGSDIKIGTADSWNKYQDGTADPLIPHLNLMYVYFVLMPSHPTDMDIDSSTHLDIGNRKIFPMPVTPIWMTCRKRTAISRTSLDRLTPLNSGLVRLGGRPTVRIQDKGRRSRS